MKPSALESDIGRRIRRLRTTQGWSLEAVATKANISRSLLSKVENGRVSSPIATLANIATALGASVGRLIGTDEDQRCVVVRRDERKPLTRKGTAFGYTYQALGYKRVDKRMEPFIVTYPAGIQKIEKFSHTGEAFLFVLKGRIELHYDDAMVVLQPGDSVYFDNELPHGCRARGAGPATALVVTYES